LSDKDSYYKKGQNYWTSPIWININYLIVKVLNNLKKMSKYSYLEKDYISLRENIVNNMVRNFKENGYIWEVYDDVSGNGKYNHPFTGWSVLIVNLIYEMF
jgi:mannosyl-oligosaccharide glucosidase